MELSIEGGTEFVKKKLERDYNKLSARTREILKDRYQSIMEVLFCEGVKEWINIELWTY